MSKKNVIETWKIQEHDKRYDVKDEKAFGSELINSLT